MHRTGFKGYAPGFTLVELMVTIAIVAILAAIAFPSFQGSFRSNRLATATNELIGSLSLARSEAIRSTESAKMCPSADGAACTNNWNDGWIVWVDSDGNDAINGSETAVRNVQGHSNLSLAMLAGGGAAANMIGFDSRGRLDNGAIGTRTFELMPSDCPSGQELVRTLTLNSVGQIGSESGACP